MGNASSAKKAYVKEELPRESHKPQFSTIIEALEYWSEKYSTRVYCCFSALSGKEDFITFRELYAKSYQCARFLQKNGLQKSDRVILAIPNSLEFLYTFLGVLMAGGAAVPIVTRESVLSGMHQSNELLEHITKDSQAKFVLTTEKSKKIFNGIKTKLKTDSKIYTCEEIPHDITLTTKIMKVSEEDIAFLQYTSGSTHFPKGVVIKHKQLISQVKSIMHGLNTNQDECAVSWLPLFHDMGLIGGFLHTLYVGMKFVLMTPEKFLFDPKQWLKAISKYKANLSAGPNAAYNMCVTRIRTEDLKGLDLSNWRVAFSGAEPISVDIMESFSKKFQPFGFNPKSIVPGYGMAENCLAISICEPGSGLSSDCIEREAFETQKKAVATQRKSLNSICFVSVGKPIIGHEVRIVDKKGQTLSEREVGEILVRGPCVMAGYFHRTKETRDALHQSWLHTGDLGYLVDNNLYITGRKKDMIIKAGRNYMPQDFEAAAEEIPQIRKGCVVAVGVYNEKEGTEKIVVLAEARPQFYKDHPQISKDVSYAIFKKTGVAPDQVLIYRRGTLTRTTSGKLQRAKYKKLYESGNLKMKTTWPERIRFYRYKVKVMFQYLIYDLKLKFKR